MPKTKILLVAFLMASILVSYAQQYNSAIYISPNVIGEKDISVFDTLTYKGWTYQEIFDRRIMQYDYVDVVSYWVEWEGEGGLEIQVHKELYTDVNKDELIDDYVIPFAYRIGQLPQFMLRGIHRVVLLKGKERWSASLGSIYIHVDHEEKVGSGFVEEVLIHEGGHAALDEKIGKSEEWRDAQLTDSISISNYAAENVKEDLTESIVAWIAVRYRSNRISKEDSVQISRTMPARLAYLDSLNLDMYPLDVLNEFDYLYEYDRHDEYPVDLVEMMSFEEFMYKLGILVIAILVFFVIRAKIRQG